MSYDGQACATYTITRRREHCHRCQKLRPCVVRINGINPSHPKKTALCEECAPKEHA